MTGCLFLRKKSTLFGTIRVLESLFQCSMGQCTSSLHCFCLCRYVHPLLHPARSVAFLQTWNRSSYSERTWCLNTTWYTSPSVLHISVGVVRAYIVTVKVCSNDQQYFHRSEYTQSMGGILHFRHSSSLFRLRQLRQVLYVKIYHSRVFVRRITFTIVSGFTSV